MLPRLKESKYCCFRWITSKPRNCVQISCPLFEFILHRCRWNLRQLATTKLQKQASLLKSYTSDLQAWPRWKSTVLGMINWSLHKVWFDKIASVIVYNKQKSNFPNVFYPTNFPITERFVMYWQTPHFITEHKFNHKFEIAVIQITVEYYRLSTSRCLVELVQILLQNWMLLIWSWSRVDGIKDSARFSGYEPSALSFS